ncbi:activating signal cointegrator 1 complex subunit 1 isoform X2 [Nilaparvata lugens]|uniref:activating signal cointegrator 1 complex subunit 1 isoform X2 n=1 Tax=Nilaparvata lugens TaxID=108931 RepID=UPI00193CAC63|nr:activating signal cointegrator 1 complex subunit 1 isoform X2 [Nilaparvata lugens]
MDVLKPNFLLIEGRCYRINPTDDYFDNSTANDLHEEHFQRNTYDEECRIEEPYEEHDNDNFEDEDDYFKCKIELTEGKKYQTTFHVPRSFFSIIIGTKHATRKRLENETKTEIIIPKFGNSGDIVVKGSSRSGVEAVYRRISIIVMTARKRQQFTHFISIPFLTDRIRERFLSFKSEILANMHGERGIVEEVFQKPEKLHMTLCVMVLSDEVERAKAIEVLNRCKAEVLDELLKENPLKVKISGVEIMNDDPAEARVVYGRIHCDDEERLQNLSDRIVDYVAKAGVLEKEHEKVKMHITLMNTSFLKDDRDSKKVTINAVPIIDAFGFYNFGEVTIDTIHLSQKGAYSATGYYKSSLVLNIT